jgi:hypothetical protein
MRGDRIVLGLIRLDWILYYFILFCSTVFCFILFIEWSVSEGIERIGLDWMRWDIFLSFFSFSLSTHNIIAVGIIFFT